MAVPYTFGTATSSIPLSQLDSNFATAITLGSTNVYLGNTTTTLVGFANLSSTLITSPTHNSSTTLSLQTGGTTGLYIDASQNVGIGTTSPSNKLTVAGNGNYTGALDVVTNTTAGNGLRVIADSANTYAGIQFTNNPITTAWGYYRMPAANVHAWYDGSGNERMRIDTSGNLLVGYSTLPANSGKLNVYGNIAWGDQSGTGRIYSDSNWGCFLQASKASPAISNFVFFNSAGAVIFAVNSALGTGTVYSNAGYLTNTNPSDITLKTNIEDLSFGLDFINNLKPVTFDWIDDVGNQGKQYGFIAQDVQKIKPELVKEFSYNPPSSSENPLPSETKLGLEEKGIFTAMVKAIQELKAEFDAYKASHP
jgi:hypothetical protein